jgi:hypothetical protein
MDEAAVVRALSAAVAARNAREVDAFRDVFAAHAAATAAGREAARRAAELAAELASLRAEREVRRSAAACEQPRRSKPSVSRAR